MKIIIVGAGKVGGALTAQLATDHQVTVIDPDAELVNRLVNTYDVMGVTGNGATKNTQLEAQIEKADLLIATADTDELNLLACLVARKLGVQHTIARIRNPEYSDQVRFMRADLGLSMAINPEEAAAREIARVLRFPAAVKVESFSKGRIELVEYRLPKDSALDGMRLMDLYRNIRVRILICAVERKEGVFIPSGETVLKAGDAIYLTASNADLTAFFEHLGVFRKKASSVMIVGASKMCYYLAKELQEYMSVKIIDQNAERCQNLSEALPKALVIEGDGTDAELLREEGLEQTDAFVAITGIDEANILMAMSASKVNNDCKVVVKINRQSLIDLVSGNGMIDSVISARTVTVELITQYIRAMENASEVSSVRTLHRLVEGKVEALEFRVSDNSPVAGIPLRDLRLKNGILVAGIVRVNGSIVIPSGQDMLYSGDDVIVVTTDTTLQDLRDILE